ncbi:hypothetical protein QBC38DRAFT_489075 [Podospora fimiseda]|uniref:Uncharacterized protein n=1 Tax=Podospora fimiseda TaxID=252190 RepID=A0AAN7BEG0_9PEZI|nr:hypothetical protein QBC38DRAFT_489075 [Podospora fimiseda]
MKPLTTILFCLPLATATDYFFSFTSGNAITNSQRLRFNNSIPISSPGASAAPHNPADHFSRIYVNGSAPLTQATLYVVPTNPHPPPVPGYYALSGQEKVPDAWRLIQSYRPQDFAPGEFRFDDWTLKDAGGNRTLLRYGTDDLGEWRWIAVREVSNLGVERWVPWWVKPTEGNLGNLTNWEYVVVELELVVAKGPVNSLAPGGILE